MRLPYDTSAKVTQERYNKLSLKAAAQPSGKAEVCKTSIPQFKSGCRLKLIAEIAEELERVINQQFQIQNVVQDTKVLKCLRSRGFVSICGISVMLYLVIDQVCSTCK